MGWKIKLPKIKVPKLPEVINVLTKAENLAAAGKVIVGIASALDAADAENNQLKDPVLQLLDNYERASRVLEQRADISETLTDELELPTGGATRARKVVALWENPTAVTGDSPEHYDMYSDLSTILATAGVPSKIEVGPGLEKDTTAIIAKAIFANAPVLVDPASDEDPVKTLDFKITSHKKDCAIRVKHAFYSIPLSSRTQERCWHSAIHVKMTAAKELLRAQDQMASRFFDASENILDSGPHWVSTVMIHWFTRPDAEAALKAVFDHFQQKLSDYKLESNSALGVTQVLKVKSPEDTSPAVVRAKVRSIIQEMLSSGPAGFTAIPDIDVSGVEMTFDN